MQAGGHAYVGGTGLTTFTAPSKLCVQAGRIVQSSVDETVLHPISLPLVNLPDGSALVPCLLALDTYSQWPATIIADDLFIHFNLREASVAGNSSIMSTSGGYAYRRFRRRFMTDIVNGGGYYGVDNDFNRCEIGIYGQGRLCSGNLSLTFTTDNFPATTNLAYQLYFHMVLVDASTFVNVVNKTR